MNTYRSVRVALAAVLLTTAIAAPSAREARIKVTSGQAVVAWDDPSSFALHGNELDLTGLFVRVSESAQDICFRGCTPGTRVDLSAVFGGPLIGSLGQSFTAVVQGVTYAPTDDESNPSLVLAGELHFRAPPVRLPPLSDPNQHQVVFVTAPFAFTGHIAGFAPDAADGSALPLFHVRLVGRGTARLRLVNIGGAWGAPEITYEFEAPASRQH